MTAALAVDAPGPDFVAARALANGTIEDRAVDALLRCVARHGLAKTTVADIAREAECSPAMLYRYFGTRQGVVSAAVRAETARVVRVIHTTADAATSLEDAVVAMLLVGGRELGEHPALRFVADFEPELLLPYLTFGGGDQFLCAAADALAPALVRFLGPDATRGAEWVARIALSLWLSPSAPVSLSSRDDLHRYVRAFVLPALERSPVPPVPSPKG